MCVCACVLVSFVREMRRVIVRVFTELDENVRTMIEREKKVRRERGRQREGERES